MPDLTSLSDDIEGNLPPGTRLGKYEIVRLLGAGGMGSVYEATHTEIGKPVAVKVLSPSIAAIPGARGRFLREAQLTSRVRHPNIVDVTDMGSEGRQTYLVMELFRGEDLAQRVARAGQLSPQEAADIMLPVCSAVVAAHNAGVTHRDLKPSNIFLSESQYGLEPKILDFGISKSLDAGIGPDALTGTGAVVGTPFYLAPEQVIDNRSAGPASDQYALGVILYESLTGRRPYHSDSLYAVFNDIVTGSPVPLRAHRPDLPPSLEQIVLRAMNVDPKARYDSTKDLGRALLSFASNRVRSIWQDAFDVDDRPAESSGPIGATGEARPARALPVTRVLTPSANVGPGGPVGLAGGTQVAMPSGSPRIRVSLPEIADDETPKPIAVDLRPSRLWLRLGIAGSLMLGGAVAWFALGDTPAGSSQVGSAKKPRRPLNRADTPADQPVESAQTEVVPHARQPEAFELVVSVDPDTALIELDGRAVGRGRLERSLPLDHTPHRMRLVADGYESQIVEFTDTPPPKQLTLTRVARTGSDRPSRERAQAPSRHKRRRRLEASPQDIPRAPSRSGALSPNGAPIID